MKIRLLLLTALFLFSAMDNRFTPEQNVSHVEVLFKQNDFTTLVKMLEPSLLTAAYWHNNKEAEKALVYYLKSLSILEQQSKTLEVTNKIGKLIPPGNERLKMILDFFRGCAMIVLQDHHQGQKLFHRIIDNYQVLEPDLDSLVVKSHANIALSHHIEGEWLKADEYYSKTIAMIEQRQSTGQYDETLATVSANYLNLLFDNLERYHDAGQLLHKVMSRQSNKEINQWNHHLFLIAAEYYIAIGDHRKFKTIADDLESYYISRKTGIDGDLGYLFLRKAIYYSNMGDNTRSIMLAIKAEKLLAGEEGLFNYLPDVHDLLIRNYALKGEVAAAAGNIKKLLATNRKSERYPDFFAYLLAAKHSASINRIEDALCYADSGTMAFNRIKDPSINDSQLYHNEMASFGMATNDTKTVMHHLILLKNLSTKKNTNPKLKDLETELGLIFCTIDNTSPDSSIKHLNRIRFSIDSLQMMTRDLKNDALDRNTALWNLNSLTATAWLKKAGESGENKDLDSAWYYFDLSMKDQESRLSNLRFDEDRISFSNDINHYLMIGFNIAKLKYEKENSAEDLNRLIAISQKAKGSALKTRLTLSRTMKNAGIPSPMIKRHESLQEENRFLNAAIESMSQSSNDSATNILISKQRMVMMELDRIHDTIKSLYPEFNLTRKTDLVSIGEIRNKLNAGNAILDYVIYKDQCVITVIRKDAVKIVTTSWTTHDSELLKSLVAGLGTPFLGIGHDGYKKFIDPAVACYQKLIAPVNEYIEGCRLTIIPHRELNELPFEVLADKPDPNESFKHTNYLILNHDISYSTSLSLIPDYNGTKVKIEGISAFAPTYPDNIINDTSIVQLPPLPWAAKKLEMIGKYWHLDKHTGKEAGKNRFSGDENSNQIVHLAMHALINNTAPMQSSLIFTNGAGQYQPLKAFEIYNLSFPTPLVVLNACNTGIGSHINGEGLLNLTRAFQYAGAQSVINTLWQVNDQTGALIMAGFYKYLKQGLAKDEALARSKKEYLQKADNLTAHPYYWACHTITGDTTPLIQKDYKLAMILVMVALMVAAAYFFLKRKKVTAGNR